MTVPWGALIGGAATIGGQILNNQAGDEARDEDREYDAQRRREERQADREDRLEALRQQALRDKYVTQQQAIQNLAGGYQNVIGANRAASGDMINQYNNIGDALARIYLRG